MLYGVPSLLFPDRGDQSVKKFMASLDALDNALISTKEEWAAEELKSIMDIPFSTAVVGGVTMRVYDSDRGFAAAVWDTSDPQDVAAVMCDTHLMVGCPPYKPTLEEQGIAVDKPLYPRFGIVQDPAEVKRIKAELNPVCVQCMGAGGGPEPPCPTCGAT